MRAIKFWRQVTSLFVALAFLLGSIPDASSAPNLVSNALITPAGALGGTSPATSTIGATLFVVVTSASVSATPTDSSGNTYTSIGSSFGNGFSVITTWYCYNPITSGTTTWSVSSANSSAAIATFDGVLTSGGFDSGVARGAFTTNSTTVQPGSATPAANGELLVASLSIAGASGAAVSGIDSSFNITDTLPFSSGNYYGVGLAWRVQATAAAINPTWTLASTPLAMSAQISGYKASSTTANKLFFHSFPP